MTKLTVDKAIKWFRENPFYHKNHEPFNMAIKALEQTRWIPVSEKTPKENCAVFVWCPESRNNYCAYLEEGQWWIFGAHYEKVKFKVEAWMPPLPAPGKEK